MKVIVAGSRTFIDYGLVRDILNGLREHNNMGTIISGHARGADMLGEKYAIDYKLLLEVYPAEWDKHGNKAGFIRNEQMAKEGDLLVAFWDGKSKGTQHTIRIAKQLHKPCLIIKV